MNSILVSRILPAYDENQMDYTKVDLYAREMKLNDRNTGQ
jgi:hypothetical protein